VARGQLNFVPMAIGILITVLLALLIGVLTLAPVTPGGPAGSDKAYHALAFASLAFPLSLVRPKLTLWVMAGVIAYGGVIELIQPFFGRDAEWSDLMADAIGAVMGAAAGYFLSTRIVPQANRRSR
jgi:VanZ family protein